MASASSLFGLGFGTTLICVRATIPLLKIKKDKNNMLNYHKKENYHGRK